METKDDTQNTEHVELEAIQDNEALESEIHKSEVMAEDEFIDDGDEDVAEVIDIGAGTQGINVKIITDLQRDIETLRRDKTEQEEQVLRVQAEMQNLRKRVNRDVENAHKYALEKFVLDLLPVVDSLERGIETVPEGDEAQKAAREGLILTLKMLSDSLHKFSVEVVDPTGMPFNPQYHEAITMIPQPDVAPNTVINTVQKGYLLSGRLVRPAMVVVAKGV